MSLIPILFFLSSLPNILIFLLRTQNKMEIRSWRCAILSSSVHMSLWLYNVVPWHPRNNLFHLLPAEKQVAMPLLWVLTFFSSYTLVWCRNPLSHYVSDKIHKVLTMYSFSSIELNGVHMHRPLNNFSSLSEAICLEALSRVCAMTPCGRVCKVGWKNMTLAVFDCPNWLQIGYRSRLSLAGNQFWLSWTV